MIDTHPSPTARSTGRELHEPHKYRCGQCGMMNDDRRAPISATGQGDGITHPDSGAADFTIESGCAFCGTHNPLGRGRHDASARRRALVTDRAPGDDAIV